MQQSKSFLKQKCISHNRVFQLVGNDIRCETNCLICIECLKTVENKHKKNGLNHQSISIETLDQQFHKIYQLQSKQMDQCQKMLDSYFQNIEKVFKQILNGKKQQIQKIVNKLMLSSIIKEQQKLQTICSLYMKQYQNINCSQIGKISEQLFSYEPKQRILNPSFQKMMQYTKKKQLQVNFSLKNILEGEQFKNIMLSRCENEAQLFKIETPRQSRISLKASRTKTEQDSTSKLTLRKSIANRKHQKNLKQIQVGLKKIIQFPNSKLVESQEQTVFLNKTFDRKRLKGSKMLYRASQHNFSVHSFHELCDNVHDTLIVVKTQFGKVIGGFTPLPWKSSSNTLHSDSKRQSFIFSLTLKQKMNLIDQNSAIFNSVNFGPTFGAGADLAICHNANVEKTSYSQFPYSYANNRYKQFSQHSTALFTGQKQGNHFYIQQWEVWKIYFEK